MARCAAAAPARLASAGLRPGRCCSSQGPTSGQRPTPRARSWCPSRCQATRAATAPARERAGERRPAPGARTSCGRRTGCGEHRRQARVALLPHAPRRQARLPPQLPRPVGANVGGPWHREAAADHACPRRPRNCCDACGTRAVTRAATLTSESQNAQHKIRLRSCTAHVAVGISCAALSRCASKSAYVATFSLSAWPPGGYA